LIPSITSNAALIEQKRAKINIDFIVNRKKPLKKGKKEQGNHPPKKNIEVL
jgi:hypothetical protein